MKTTMVFLFCFFIFGSAFADQLDRVAVWDDDPPSITYFDRRDMQKYGITSEDEFIAWYTNRLKAGAYQGRNFTIIPKANIPADDSQRLDWSLKGNKVEVDAAKVAAKQAAKAAKESRKRALLKLTPAEFEEAKELGIIK